MKPIKTQASKATSINKAFALPEHTAKIEQLAWSSPITVGPYLVPVTRWVE